MSLWPLPQICSRHCEPTRGAPSRDNRSTFAGTDCVCPEKGVRPSRRSCRSGFPSADGTSRRRTYPASEPCFLAQTGDGRYGQAHAGNQFQKRSRRHFLLGSASACSIKSSRQGQCSPARPSNSGAAANHLIMLAESTSSSQNKKGEARGEVARRLVERKGPS